MKDILIIAHFTQIPGEAGNSRFNYIAEIINKDEDSLRFYYLGNNWKNKVEHIGTKKSYNPEGVLIL